MHVQCIFLYPWYSARTSVFMYSVSNCRLMAFSCQSCSLRTLQGKSCVLCFVSSPLAAFYGFAFVEFYDAQSAVKWMDQNKVHTCTPMYVICIFTSQVYTSTHPTDTCIKIALCFCICMYNVHVYVHVCTFVMNLS